MKQNLLEMKNITKAFGGTKALKDGMLEVFPGEIHALIGANGAGKSTLMNILYGILRPDGGEILFEGRKVRFHSILEAQRAGIFMVHQELNVVNDLTVAQNIFLGREPMLHFSVDDERMVREASELLSDMGIDIDPTERMGDLSPAKQQLIQIAGLMSRKLKLLILDEPTTALGEEDVERLFAMMRLLKEKGISMIFISHRLDELFAVSDRITVMRDGSFVSCHPAKEMTKEQLIFDMTGKIVNDREREAGRIDPEAPVVLEVRGLCTKPLLRDISFSLKKGEILGLAGLMGSGRTETARAICGIDRAAAGTIKINGECVRIRSPKDAASFGIGYLSEDRNTEGVIPGKNLIFNTAISSLDRYRKGFASDDEKLTEDAVRFNEMAGTVAPEYSSRIESLSGGNKQKVLIARALMQNLQILIFDEPTKGIDVGAKDEIYQVIESLAEEGHSVIVISSETEEIRSLCDRAIVLYEGTVAGEIPAGQMTPERIMYYAAGLKDEK